MADNTRTFIEIKNDLLEYAQQNYSKTFEDNRTPYEIERDFLIMEIVKLKQVIEMAKQQYSSDIIFTKQDAILLMEWARDKGERDGEILWDEWLVDAFKKISDGKCNIK